MSNLLSLEQFRSLLQINPYWFWGLANSEVPLVSGCDIAYEYNWQASDRTSRQDVREAIERAEGRLREYLGFDVAPTYREATIPYARPENPNWWFGAPIDPTGRRISVQLPDGYVQALGVETVTLRDASPIIAYSDANGDGLLDTATITATVPSGTDASSLAVYVPTAQQPDALGRVERWRIRPLRTSVSNTTATITGPSWLFIRPMLYEGVGRSTLDPDQTSNYLTAVDVCTRTTNGNGTTTATSQAVLTYETLPYPEWAGCCDTTVYIPSSSTDPAAIAQVVARVGIRDAQHGLVTPQEAAYDTTTGLWGSVCWSLCWRQPDRVTVRYLAGYPLTDGLMAGTWAEVVAGFAAAELQRPICACEVANAKLYYYQTDLARTGGNAGDQYGAVAAQDLDCPFGTRRGHIRAWRAIRNARQLRGFRP